VKSSVLVAQTATSTTQFDDAEHLVVCWVDDSFGSQHEKPGGIALISRKMASFYPSEWLWFPHPKGL
jgi:hypothetical protein